APGSPGCEPRYRHHVGAAISVYILPPPLPAVSLLRAAAPIPASAGRCGLLGDSREPVLPERTMNHRRQEARDKDRGETRLREPARSGRVVAAPSCGSSADYLVHRESGLGTRWDH